MRRERFLTEREVAERLSLSTKALSGWRMRGLEPGYVRLNGAIRYKESVIDEFVERGTIRTAKEQIA